MRPSGPGANFSLVDMQFYLFEAVLVLLLVKDQAEGPLGNAKRLDVFIYSLEQKGLLCLRRALESFCASLHKRLRAAVPAQPLVQLNR